jgi:hypothetical protein
MDADEKGNAASLADLTTMGKVHVDSQQHEESSLKARPLRTTKPPTHCKEKKTHSQTIPSLHQRRGPHSYDSTSYVGPTSRCMSQPSTTPSHFLKGFNVASCFDVRSIPDPPTPIALSRHKHRRLSTPNMMSAGHGSPGNRGLDDVTNNQRSGELIKRKSSDRKRKSLIHVPSPIADEACKDVTQKEERPSKVLQFHICMEEEEVERTRISHKRRKQRQSMVVRTQLNLSPSPEKSLSFSPFQAKSQLVEIPSSPGHPTELFSGKKESMEELRALVRAHCNATNAEKLYTDFSNRIQGLTGYPMPGRIATQAKREEKAETDNDVIKANRRCVFSKISPAMSLMEKQKEQDTKQWEHDTGCRVGKSEKSGKYRYFSTDDQQRVPSQDYQRRYMVVLKQTRPNRVAAAKVWMTKLEETKPLVKMATDADDQTSLGPTDYEQATTTTVSNDALTDEPDEDCPSLVLHEQQQREAFLPPKSDLLRRKSTGSNADDAMDVCDLSASLDCGDQANMARASLGAATAFAAEISEASSEDTEETESRTATPSPLHVEFVASLSGCQAVGPVLVAQSRDEGTDAMSNIETQEPTRVLGDIPMLPLPSREVESLDPEIAQAEKRLWEKIDSALKEYSEQVIGITKAGNDRARGQKQHAQFTL